MWAKKMIFFAPHIFMAGRAQSYTAEKIRDQASLASLGKLQERDEEMKIY